MVKSFWMPRLQIQNWETFPQHMYISRVGSWLGPDDIVSNNGMWETTWHREYSINYQLTWLSLFECLVSKFRIGKPSPNTCTSAGSGRGSAQMILYPVMGCKELLGGFHLNLAVMFCSDKMKTYETFIGKLGRSGTVERNKQYEG